MGDFINCFNVRDNRIVPPRKASGVENNTDVQATTPTEMLDKMEAQSKKLRVLSESPETTPQQKMEIEKANIRLKKAELGFIAYLNGETPSFPQSSAKQEDLDSPTAIEAQQLLERVETQKSKLDALLESPTTTAKEKLQLNIAKARLTNIGNKFEQNQSLISGEMLT